MRLVTFQSDDAPRLGALVGAGEVLDLSAANHLAGGADDPRLASMLALMESGEAGLELAAGLVGRAAALADAQRALGAVRLLAPVPRPPSIRDFLCFEDHLVNAFRKARELRAAQSEDPEAALAEMERTGVLAVPAAWYERPLYYKANPANVCGPDVAVRWPAYSDVVDFELEFGCFIGRPGKDIPRERALDHVFGFTIFNDLSARDEQVRDMPGQLGPGKGKDFDDSKPMGPCVVTRDELGDPYALTLIARVNGEEWARGSSAAMRWRFEDCIAHISRDETLLPGDFFASGTVGGGCGLETLRFPAPGDLIELEVENIGVLATRIQPREARAA